MANKFKEKLTTLRQNRKLSNASLLLPSELIYLSDFDDWNNIFPERESPIHSLEDRTEDYHDISNRNAIYSDPGPLKEQIVAVTVCTASNEHGSPNSNNMITTSDGNITIKARTDDNSREGTDYVHSDLVPGLPLYKDEDQSHADIAVTEGGTGTGVGAGNITIKRYHYGSDSIAPVEVIRKQDETDCNIEGGKKEVEGKGEGQERELHRKEGEKEVEGKSKEQAGLSKLGGEIQFIDRAVRALQYSTQHHTNISDSRQVDVERGKILNPSISMENSLYALQLDDEEDSRQTDGKRKNDQGTSQGPGLRQIISPSASTTRTWIAALSPPSSRSKSFARERQRDSM